MDKITVKNISTATVRLIAPGVRFDRELAPGRVVPLTEDEYDELMADAGVESLLRSHFIAFNGVSEEKQPVIIDNVFTKDDIADMLDKSDITAFAKFIPTATEAEKDSVVQLAVDKGITHSGFVALIKKYCDVDIINAINVKHQSEEK